MISDQTLQKLNQLHEEEGEYRPSLHVAEQLSSKSIIMLVGPTGVGKNRVMETVEQLDGRFRVASNRTSRAPREGDDHAHYTYYEHSDDGLRSLLQAIEKHTLVQYVINPYSQFIYGTTISDYPGEYNLKDVFSSAIDDFRKLGFKQATAISIVSQPTVWLQRFEARYPQGHPERKGRRDENIESLTWSLAQTADHFWVENIDGDPEVAAQKVIAITLGESTGDPDARTLTEACLEAAKTITI